MLKHRFIYNLTPDTCEAFFRESIAPSGYLLAPNNATPKSCKMAALVKKENQCDLFADNGNYSRIQEMKKMFAKESESLLKLIETMEKKIGHYVQTSDVPSNLRKPYRNLLQRTIKASESIVQSDENLISSQLAYSPTHLIGVENITMAIMLSLSIEAEYVDYPVSFFRKLNEDVARRAVQQIGKLGSLQQGRYYPVVSAISYDTAYDAGALFAKYKLERASMGFGAYMSDNNYSDHAYIKGQLLEFQDRLPNKYTRTVLVAKGFWDGYENEAGTAPKAFHFLGLGAPIMIPLVSICAWETPEISFDATSPIRDAIEGTFYFSTHGYVKSQAKDIAFKFASGKFVKWDCSCPFCDAFLSKTDFDYGQGKEWFVLKNPSSVEKIDLKPGGGLYEAFPLLSEPMGGTLRKRVSYARMGHNHWVIEQIVSMLNENSKTELDIRTHVRDIVKSYAETTNSKLYARAIQFAYDLAIQK